MELKLEPLVNDYKGESKRPVKPNDYKSTYTDKDNNIVENIPGSRKWYQSQAEWLWWMYCNGYSDINYSLRSDMIMNRLYAEGRQPVSKYMAPWVKRDPKTNRMKTWANISFDIYAILPKFVSYVRGLFDKIDFNLEVNAINAGSIQERNLLIAKEIAVRSDEGFYQYANTMLGQEQDEQQLPFIPENDEQAQMLIDMGFVKLPDEVIMEQKLNAAAVESRWTEVIKSKIHFDLFVQGMAATKVYKDPVTGAHLIRYANIENMIALYHNRDMFYEQLSYVAEIVPYTLGDLRAAGFKDEDLREAASYYSNRFGNPMISGINYPGSPITPAWMDMVVYVLDAEFESIDFQKHQWVDFEGEKIPVPLTDDKKDKGDDKTFMTSYPKWHRCKWVIGMGENGVFDYGFQFDVPYTQDGRPQSSYSIVRAVDRSPINLAIADADEVQNLILKRRAAIAKLRPPGTIFDKNTITELQIGGEKFSLLDQLNMFTQTGDILISNPRTPTGQAIPGVPPAFADSKGNVDALVYYDNAINAAIMRMSDKLGVSSPVEGSQPDPRTPVRTTMISLQGSNNILQPLVMAYRSLKMQSFDKLAARFEIVEKAEMLERGFNTEEELIKYIDNRRYSLKVDAVIDDEVKQNILMKADLSLQAAKTGGVGIEYSDYFVVQSLVRRGLLKSAQWYLSWKEAERRDHAIQMQRENMELNNRGALEQQAAKLETAKQLQDMKTQSAMAIDTNKIIEQMKKELELTIQKGLIEIEKIKKKAEADAKIQATKPKET
jgi:hypothetical protein